VPVPIRVKLTSFCKKTILIRNALIEINAEAREAERRREGRL
jgi:hypothetical protein